MMKKQQIYVSIADRKQAKHYRHLLMALDQPVYRVFYEEGCKYLVWDELHDHWFCSLQKEQHQVSIKELINLLANDFT